MLYTQNKGVPAVRILHGYLQKARRDADELPFRIRKHGSNYAVCLIGGEGISIHHICSTDEAAETWLMSRLIVEQ